MWGAPRKEEKRPSNPMHGKRCSRFLNFSEVLSLHDELSIPPEPSMTSTAQLVHATRPSFYSRVLRQNKHLKVVSSFKLGYSSTAGEKRFCSKRATLAVRWLGEIYIYIYIFLA